MRGAGLLLLLCSCGGVPGASFSLSWRLVDAREPSPETAPSLSCVRAGVGTVRLGLRAAAGPMVQVDFVCAQQSGITDPVRRDRYTVLVQALASDGRPLSQLTFAESNEAGPRDLGLIIFQIPL